MGGIPLAPALPWNPSQRHPVLYANPGTNGLTSTKLSHAASAVSREHTEDKLDDARGSGENAGRAFRETVARRRSCNLSDGEVSSGVLLHGTGNKPANREIDVSLIYGDYFFIEALLRYRAITMPSVPSLHGAALALLAALTLALGLRAAIS